MHYRLVYLLLITINCSAFAQKKDSIVISEAALVGVWQVNSSRVTSTLQANFQFFKNKRFTYNVNGYDDLNPIYTISGTYKIDKDVLYLKIEEFKQLTGFKVSASEPAYQFGSFVLGGGKLVTIKQNDADYSEHEISLVKSQKLKCIEIDNRKYFKLSSDPNKFSK